VGEELTKDDGRQTTEIGSWMLDDGRRERADVDEGEADQAAG
jgi:hypothetical protein